jgi:hypothetical protein
MKTKTKLCSSCGQSFECERPARARYCPACNTSTARNRRSRARHARPVSLERVVASQRRAGRKVDAHVQRPQELGGASVRPILQTRPEGSPSDLVVIEPDGSSHVVGAAYAKTVRGGMCRNTVDAGEPADPTPDEVIWREQHPEIVTLEALELAAREWVYFVVCGRLSETDVPIFRGPRLAARRVLWFVRWRRHPELSEAQRRYVVWRVPALFQRVIDKEKKPVIETVAAQNEEILAKIERLREMQTEMLEKLADTVERVRDRFPNDSEVSAAVDRFLEDVGP